MAKSSIVEKHTKSITGVLDVAELSMECEDLGIKKISDLFAKFDGELIKVTINLTNEIDN